MVEQCPTCLEPSFETSSCSFCAQLDTTINALPDRTEPVAVKNGYTIFLAEDAYQKYLARIEGASNKVCISPPLVVLWVLSGEPFPCPSGVVKLYRLGEKLCFVPIAIGILAAVVFKDALYLFICPLGLTTGSVFEPSVLKGYLNILGFVVSVVFIVVGVLNHVWVLVLVGVALIISCVGRRLMFYPALARMRHLVLKKELVFDALARRYGIDVDDATNKELYIVTTGSTPHDKDLH